MVGSIQVFLFSLLFGKSLSHKVLAVDDGFKSGYNTGPAYREGVDGLTAFIAGIFKGLRDGVACGMIFYVTCNIDPLKGDVVAKIVGNYPHVICSVHMLSPDRNPESKNVKFM